MNDAAEKSGAMRVEEMPREKWTIVDIAGQLHLVEFTPAAAEEFINDPDRKLRATDEKGRLQACIFASSILRILRGHPSQIAQVSGALPAGLDKKLKIAGA